MAKGSEFPPLVVCVFSAGSCACTGKSNERELIQTYTESESASLFLWSVLSHSLTCTLTSLSLPPSPPSLPPSPSLSPSLLPPSSLPPPLSLPPSLPLSLSLPPSPSLSPSRPLSAVQCSVAAAARDGCCEHDLHQDSAALAGQEAGGLCQEDGGLCGVHLPPTLQSAQFNQVHLHILWLFARQLHSQ